MGYKTPSMIEHEIITRAQELVREQGGEIASRQIRALARAVSEQISQLYGEITIGTVGK
jgi:hypothetical protein